MSFQSTSEVFYINNQSAEKLETFSRNYFCDKTTQI